MMFRFAFLGLALVASGQTTPVFEVASIRPSNSADRRPLFMFEDGGRFTAANITVKKLIQSAYNIKEFQISGGPGWIGSDLYDINAKPDTPPKPELMMEMIKSLLAERFQLTMRRNTKEMPVYALVIAKNGPKMKAAAESAPRAMKVRRGLLSAPQANMTGLTNQLSTFLGRTVVDQTGLTGTYDLKLEWVPDEYEVAMFSGMGVPEGFGAPAPDWHGPTLFTALEEQLGLKLESRKRPVEIFAIERVERPAAN